MAKKKKKRPPFRLEMGWGGVIAVVTGAFVAILWTFVLGVWVGKKVATPKGELTAPLMESRYGEGNLGAKKAAVPQSAPLFTMEKKVAPGANVVEEVPEGPEVPTSAPRTIEKETREERGKVAAPLKEEVVKPKKEPKEEAKAPILPEKAPHLKKEAKKPVVTVKAKRLSKARPRPFFALQVASFKDLKYAQREVIRWENLGYSATIRKVDLGPKKGTWYRVFVGRYATIAEARKGAVELAKKFKQKSYIRPVR